MGAEGWGVRGAWSTAAYLCRTQGRAARAPVCSPCQRSATCASAPAVAAADRLRSGNGPGPAACQQVTEWNSRLSTRLLVPQRSMTERTVLSSLARVRVGWAELGAGPTSQGGQGSASTATRPNPIGEGLFVTAPCSGRTAQAETRARPLVVRGLTPSQASVGARRAVRLLRAPYEEAPAGPGAGA